MRPGLASDFRKGCEDEGEEQPCEDSYCGRSRGLSLKRNSQGRVPSSVVIFSLPPAQERLEHLVPAALDAMSC